MFILGGFPKEKATWRGAPSWHVAVSMSGFGCGRYIYAGALGVHVIVPLTAGVQIIGHDKCKCLVVQKFCFLEEKDKRMDK